MNYVSGTAFAWFVYPANGTDRDTTSRPAPAACTNGWSSEAERCVSARSTIGACPGYGADFGEGMDLGNITSWPSTMIAGFASVAVTPARPADRRPGFPAFAGPAPTPAMPNLGLHQGNPQVQLACHPPGGTIRTQEGRRISLHGGRARSAGGPASLDTGWAQSGTPPSDPDPLALID